jgi:predicted transcriptional regulator
MKYIKNFESFDDMKKMSKTKMEKEIIDKIEEIDDKLSKIDDKVKDVEKKLPKVIKKNTGSIDLNKEK